MRYYRVTKSAFFEVEVIVLADDEDQAYALAYDLPDEAWQVVEDSTEIERKPNEVRDVTPPDLEAA